jgi:class 3 adenylate cyclase/Flp pilus assembly protein TadD
VTEILESRPAASLEMAHVLFMDIVSYSRLHMDQQQRVIHELQDAVRNTSEFARAQSADCLIRLPTGDGMALVFFGDPEAPVRCALELTKNLRSHPDIKLRIGIHSGPVYRIADINANRNVAGGGINMAQRVMDCGDAGHILLSKTMAEVLAQLSSWSEHLHELGQVEVKHGVRVDLVNLYTAEAGNAELPRKLRAAANASAAPSSNSRIKISLGLAAGALAAVVVGAFLLRPQKVHALTDKDTIVLADFDNATNDPVFDSTLKQALVVEIEQSPFLNTLSEQKVRDTLQLMGKPADEPLTQDLARQLCLRAGSKAFLEGRIAKGDAQYVLSLNAINCANGDALDRELTRAGSKDAVLDSLGKIADALRAKLGESLSSIRKYDMPLEDATTPSLDALNAFTLARKTQREKGDAASIPQYKRAIELDSNFALAYAGLAAAYNNLGQVHFAGENAQKAFDLRDHVSEREKLRISAFYHSYVTGDTGQAIAAYHLWTQSYPRDPLPLASLASLHAVLGQYDKSVAESLEAQRLDPDSVLIYSNLGSDYLALGRRQEAKDVFSQAAQQKLDGGVLRLARYELAFLEGDAAGMAAQLAWSAHEPGEGIFLSSQSDTEAYYGRLRKARELSRRAAEASGRSDMSEAAAIWEASAALRECDFGNPELARRDAESALAHSTGKQLWALAGLTFARSGDAARAESLVQKLQQNYPSDTLLRYYWLPVIRGSIELRRGDPAKALESLQEAAPYDLADPFPITSSPLGNMYSVYVRGQALLQARRGAEAAAEFQKILNQPGLVLNGPIGALSRVELARAYAAQLDAATTGAGPASSGGANDDPRSKARSQYEAFFALWKDADPDVPFLKEAKAAYSKLK